MIVCPDLSSMRALFSAEGRLRDVTLPRDSLVVFLETGLRSRDATLQGDANTVVLRMPPPGESGVTDTVALKMPYEGTELKVSVPIPMFVGFVVDALYRGDTLLAATIDASVKAAAEMMVWEVTRDDVTRH